MDIAIHIRIGSVGTSTETRISQYVMGVRTGGEDCISNIRMDIPIRKAEHQDSGGDGARSKRHGWLDRNVLFPRS